MPGLHPEVLGSSGHHPKTPYITVPKGPGVLTQPGLQGGHVESPHPHPAGLSAVMINLINNTINNNSVMNASEKGINNRTPQLSRVVGCVWFGSRDYGAESVPARAVSSG